MKIFVIFLLCLIFQFGLCDNEPEVLTSLGRIRGSTLTSRLGKQFYAFRGIRYGKAPIRNLRFKVPVPEGPWTDTLNATKDGPACPQSNPFLPKSEDCLFLNVYTKNILDLEPKPVIVYIHGGSLLAGSSNSEFLAGPEILMDRDVVLVTLNYRLGALGFLSTGTKEFPGNLGFKDQALALKWISNHIQNFSGDPSRVTIMGQSAGARSVMLHLVSPMSKGLFHNAIIMSGSTTHQWKIQEHQFDLAQKQAAILGCSNNSAEEIFACMKEIPAKEIGSSVENLNEFMDNPILKYFPVIEPDFGQERFLIEDPNISFLNGNFQKVPIIAGVTKDEFADPAWFLLLDDDLRDEFQNDFEKLAPICFVYERDTDHSKLISETLKKEFLKFPLSKDSMKDLNILFADSATIFGVQRFVHLAAKHTKIYNYKNTFVGRFSHFYHPDDKPYGVVHVDDLQYLLRLRYLGPLINSDDPENTTIERMTRLWTNFAATSNPNDPDDDFINKDIWTPFTYENENYLNIGNELVMEKNLYLERYRAWDQLFPVPSE